MLDLLSYLTNTSRIFVKEIALKKKIYNSSRKGFIELKGALKFATERGDTLYLCDHDFNLNKVILGGIKIENKNISYSIYEKDQKIIKVKSGKKFSFNVNEFKIPLQSQITSHYVEDILKKKKICLSTIKSSYHHHKIILKIFGNHIKKFNKRINLRKYFY